MWMKINDGSYLNLGTAMKIYSDKKGRVYADNDLITEEFNKANAEDYIDKLIKKLNNERR